MAQSTPKLPPSLNRLLTQKPVSFVMDNGLTVVASPNPAHPVVSVQVWVRTGSMHEASHPGAGLSHFLEHMLFNGTHRRGPGVISDEAHALGGILNAYTSLDRTVYHIDGPSESFPQILDLLADQTLNASLPESQVEREKEVILREIDMTRDDPDSRVTLDLYATAYRTHPFQYPVIGVRSLFEQLSHADLADYYANRYVPNNMVLSVAGNVDMEELPGQLEKTFGTFPMGRLRPVTIPGESDQMAYRETRQYGKYKLARGWMAFKIPGLRHPDAPALDLLGSILGSGKSGRLRQRIREDLELVSQVGAYVWNPYQPGMFSIHYQAEPGQAEKAESAILGYLREVTQNGFTREELEKARRFAILKEINSRKQVSGTAARQGWIQAVLGDLGYPERYFHRLYSVQLEDLQAVAEQIFAHHHLTVSSLLPESQRQRESENQARTALPPFSQKTLPNGVRLLWQRDPSLPRAWLRYSGLGGPMVETVNQRGATSLMSTLLTRDTRERTSKEVAELLETSGGFLSEVTGNNTFSLGMEVMPEGISDAIEAMGQALLQPAFLESTLSRERSAQLTHLKDMEDEILDFARLALRRHFFGQHPFASHPSGSQESVQSLTATDVRDMYQQLVIGGNSVVAITGDFEPDTTLPELEKMLLQLPSKSFDRPIVVDDTLPATTGEIVESLPREQAIVLEAYPDVGVHPDSSLVADLLDEILSDMAGPLFKAVREERSLAYFVGSSRLLGFDFGCFSLYAGTEPSSTDEVFAIFDSELNRLRSGGLTPQELEAARKRLIVHNRFTLQNPGTRATRACLNVLYGKPAMDWLTYEARLQAISTEDLTEFAQVHFQKDSRLRLTVTPN